MEYFRSGLKSVLGAPEPGNQPTGAETVERLVNRVTSSTLLDDRRDACRALRALSKKYRLEVGAQAMSALCQILELDRADCEIIGYCLDTLCNITATETFLTEEEDSNHQKAVNFNVGEQFTEMFIKTPDNVSLVLGYLEEYDFRVRWPAVKLLTSLLQNKPKAIQDIILVSPMGVSKLMDLLGENREVIRNDALLLLIQLTKSNANIQKIVAFENAFDRLFDVINEEGCTEGGIVVEDCLLLMLNLLRNNTSNINFFKEGSYIQRISPMFSIPANVEEVGWRPQKVSNMHCLLKVVRTLVSPTNPQQTVSSSQKLMRNAGLLEALCAILMASGVPADILTETVNTVGEVIRGNITNQEFFSSIQAPSNPPRAAIIVLLMSMVNEKQPFSLRCAVLYCFQSFLYRNEIGQSAVVQTLLPTTSQGSTALTTGQLLCGGLFSNDPLSNWFSSVALSHCLIDNPAQKEFLLKVLLATNLNSTPVSLLQQCAVYLQQSTKLQTKLSLLMLLNTWTYHCQSAVAVLLQVHGSMAYLTSLTCATEHDDTNEELLQSLCAFLMGNCVAFNDNSVSNYSTENLSQLIEKRVGIEPYLSKLTQMLRHEIYARAAKQPQLLAASGADLLLEYECCKLLKSMEGVIVQTLGVQRDLSNGLVSELSLGERESALLGQYKEMIREQDRRCHELQRELGEVKKSGESMLSEINELHSTVAQLQDQNTLLKAQISVGTTITTPTVTHTHSQIPNDTILNFDSSHTENNPLQSQNQASYNYNPATMYNNPPATIYNNPSTTMINNPLETMYNNPTIVNFNNDIPHYNNGISNIPNFNNELPNLNNVSQLSQSTSVNTPCSKCQELEALVAEKEGQLQRIRNDQEDLLELVTDQDLKLNSFKTRLRELGETIDEGEDSDVPSDSNSHSDQVNT